MLWTKGYGGKKTAAGSAAFSAFLPVTEFGKLEGL